MQSKSYKADYTRLASSVPLTSSSLYSTLDADHLLHIIAVTFDTVAQSQVCAEVDVKLRAALKAGVPLTGAAACSSSSDDSTSDDADADDDVVTESALDREAMTV
jgi:hypothetical protein